MKDKIGVVHGRFQIFHNDHLKYILNAKEKCEHLIIGICNPEVDLTKYNSANPHRSKKSSNPLTFFERMECIRDALLEQGISKEDFDIVPFPINFPEKIFNYAPPEAKYYLTIYDEWGEEKLKSLRDDLGLDTEVLWHVSLEEKGISSSDLRKKIQKEEDFSAFVPKAVYKYIKDHKLDQRIKEFLDEEKAL